MNIYLFLVILFLRYPTRFDNNHNAVRKCHCQREIFFPLATQFLFQSTGKGNVSVRNFYKNIHKNL